MESSLKSAIYIASYLLPFVAMIVMAIWLRQAAQPPQQAIDPVCLGLYDDSAAMRGEIPIEQIRAEAIERMRAVQSRCMSDPGFLDTFSTVMIEAGRGAELRTQLMSAKLPPDVVQLQLARIHIAEAEAHERSGDAAGANGLRHEAQTTSAALIGRWPDWQDAYTLADRAEGGGSQRFEHMFQARIDSFSPSAWLQRNPAMGWLIASGTVLAGLAALGLAYRGWTGAQQLDTTVSPIALAKPGLVALRGTVHVPPGLALLRHPKGGPDCVWYRVQSGKRMIASEQPVLLRDSSGKVLMDVGSATVETRSTDEASGPRVIGQIATALTGKSEANQALDQMLTFTPARNYLVEGDAVAVYGALAEASAKTGGVAERQVVRYDRPVLVLAANVEDKRASLRAEALWGLILGLPLLGLCAWVVREMTRSAFTPWG